MAEPKTHSPVALVVAVFSRHPEAFAWGRSQLESLHGPIALASVEFPFSQTDYYERSMGADLRKQLLVFHALIAPDRLPDIKLRTNALEREIAAQSQWPEARPLNLDPGLLTLGKFQLATVKDQAHRIYLRDGIFAEVTLRYEAGAFVPWPWTYADYRQPLVLDFLQAARDWYYRRIREPATISPPPPTSSE
ncbi:MAG: DUF4416 family protein [Planctomycetia bacterium]|nr:DUF4416 family protein [Planctomycetia bacterium]